jgi:hypothetical protein
LYGHRASRTHQEVQTPFLNSSKCSATGCGGIPDFDVGPLRTSNLGMTSVL